MEKLSKNTHLTKDEIVKNGSIFTPPYIADLVYNYISCFIDEKTIIGDFGSGYGAFIDTFQNMGKKCFGTEIDDKSYLFLCQHFNNITFYHENSLINANRKKYALKKNDKLIIVGNPPYNDTTSQYKKGAKGTILCDDDIKSRDMGISFLKLFNKLEANYVCVLHPLSFLLKKQNFNSLGEFKKNYRLLKATIFSSKEFESIKKGNANFPVIAACYERNEAGMDYNYIENFKFDIYQNTKIFCLNDIVTIDGLIPKYPSKKDSTPLQFYTQRDMNSLMRNAAFIEGPKNNGINVTIDNLYQYAWLYFLKENFKVSQNAFLYGNLSPLCFNKINEPEYKNCLVSYAYNNSNLVSHFFKKEELVEKYGQLTTNYELLYEQLQNIYYFN